MRNPLISVIIPIYNVEEYLGDCVKSITSQTYENLEILLVNDGSPDNCAALCDQYATEDSRIRVFHKPNGGLSDARNYGIAKATGEYLMFIDSDDYWLGTTAVEKLVKELKKHDSCDIVFFGRTTFMNENVFEGKPIRADLFNGDIVNDLKILLTRHDFIPSACQKMIRRSLIVDNNLYFEKGLLSEDWEWCFRLYCCTQSISGISDNFYGYRKHEGSITRSFSNKHARDILYILEQSTTRLKNSNMSPEIKDIFWGYLAYIYSCSLSVLGRLKRNERNRLYKDFKEYTYLLRHTLNPKVKKVWMLYRCLGYRFTVEILAQFLKTRPKRLK